MSVGDGNGEMDTKLEASLSLLLKESVPTVLPLNSWSLIRNHHLSQPPKAPSSYSHKHLYGRELSFSSLRTCNTQQLVRKEH